MKLRSAGSGETRSVNPDAVFKSKRFALCVGDFGKNAQCLDAHIFRAANIGRQTFVANGSNAQAVGDR